MKVCQVVLLPVTNGVDFVDASFGRRRFMMDNRSSEKVLTNALKSRRLEMAMLTLTLAWPDMAVVRVVERFRSRDIGNGGTYESPRLP